jgi:putative ABC transport system substrate-binding protein
MRLIRLVVVIGLALLATPLGAGSQPAGQKVPRIGYLDGASLSANSVRIEAFRRGLRALGYVEGQSVAIEWRSADGKADRLPGLAAELVRLKVDVIVTGGSGATAPAKEATATVPIVMASDSDPVESGFVTSLARPGGNVTGLSTLHPELSVKRLEVLKEIRPKLSRVAIFGTSSWAGNARGLRETERAAETLRLKSETLASQYLHCVVSRWLSSAPQYAFDPGWSASRRADHRTIIAVGGRGESARIEIDISLVLRERDRQRLGAHAGRATQRAALEGYDY